MKRLVFVLLGMICILPATVEAQGRGARSAIAPHLASPGRVHQGSVGPMVRPGAPFRPAPPFAVGRSFAPGIIRNPQFGIGRVHRPIVIAPPFGFYSPFLSAVPIYQTPIYAGPTYAPSIYPDPVYSSPSYLENQAPLPVNQNELDLAYQVDRLNQEVEQLRQERALTQSQPQQRTDTPTSAQPPATPTVLIFRDGHRQEIQNYAIVGQTLWVVDEHTSRKISLSDLNIDATRKENSERGIRFLPR